MVTSREHPSYPPVVLHNPSQYRKPTIFVHHFSLQHKTPYGFSSFLHLCQDYHIHIHIDLVGGLEHELYFSHHTGNVIIPIDFHHFSEG